MSYPSYGAPAQGGGAPEYAGIGVRFGAFLVDGLVAGVPYGILAGIGIAVLPDQALVFTSIGLVLLFVLLVGNIWLEGTKGASIGKKLLGLSTVGADTLQPIGFGKAFLRTLVRGALGACAVLQIVNAVVANGDSRKQSWHDRSVGSVVVRTSSLAGASAGAASGYDPQGGYEQGGYEQGGYEQGYEQQGYEQQGYDQGGYERSSWGQQSTGYETGSTGYDAAPASGGYEQPAGGDAGGYAPYGQQDEPADPFAPPAGVTPSATTQPIPTDAPSSPEPPATGGWGAPAAPPAPPAAPAARAPIVRLVMDDGTVLPRGERVVVGRSPVDAAGGLCHVLADPGRSLSKSHAAFVRSGEDLTVEDLNSTNGVAVSRDGSEFLVQPGAVTPLRVGDKVLMGDRHVVVEEI
ncbi:RDD family protein [Nocardioides zeae]